MADGTPRSIVITDTTVLDTRLVVLQSKVDACYTMHMYKYGKKIGEATSEEDDLTKLVCLLMAKMPIDPEHLNLN